jgi:hypothetical protein
MRSLAELIEPFRVEMSQAANRWIAGNPQTDGQPQVVDAVGGGDVKSCTRHIGSRIEFRMEETP